MLFYDMNLLYMQNIVLACEEFLMEKVFVTDLYTHSDDNLLSIHGTDVMSWIYLLEKHSENIVNLKGFNANSNMTFWP